MAAPLAYLVFLVPFGAFLVPALQDFTAGFVGVGLDLLDIPHAVTATMIEIPEGRFTVEEACAGLRFLIAAIAFGALYACVIYTGPWRRAAFIAVCTVVPILANGLRALGIVLLGHLRGSAAAGAVDHIVYGWLFFTLVIGLLLLLGLPFRQAPAPPVPRAARPAAAPRLAAAAATIIVLAAAATGPAVAAWLGPPAPHTRAPPG
jgi:exosortase